MSKNANTLGGQIVEFLKIKGYLLGYDLSDLMPAYILSRMLDTCHQLTPSTDFYPSIKSHPGKDVTSGVCIIHKMEIFLKV